MADEITITIRATLRNGSLKRDVNPGTVKWDQAAALAYSAVWTVGTSEENLATGDIGTEGWIFMTNLDGTNYVEWGASATTPTLATIGRLEAGETCAFRMEPSVTLRAKADTADVNVSVELWED